MKIVEYTAKRLVLDTPEEKATRLSWGNKWNALKKAEQKDGFVFLIIGEWSGYSSKQRRDVHIDISSKEAYDKDCFVGTIKYTDRTELNVRIERHSLQSILRGNIHRKPSYTSLIQSLIISGDKFYVV